MTGNSTLLPYNMITKKYHISCEISYMPTVQIAA